MANQKPISAPRARPNRVKALKNPEGLLVKSPASPPSWLTSAAGQECYHDLQGPLIEAGLLQTLDLPNLALMALYWSDYIEARDYIAKTKGTISARLNDPTLAPVVTRMDESLKKYSALLSKFAGSPIDRTKIVIRKPKEKSGLEGVFD
jgi:P27 family predicted phage terminase small subunit